MRKQIGETLIHWRNLALVIAGIAGWGIPVLLAQNTAPTAPLKFTAASVRRSPAPGPGVTSTFGQIKCLGADGLLWSPQDVRDPTPPRRGRCIGQGVSLRALVLTAYASSPIARLALSPDPTFVTIEAIADDLERVTKGELQQMLQALLEDRFKARVHTEKRELDGFALTIAKSGIKFKENTSGEERPVIFPPGVPLPPGILTTGGGKTVIGPYARYGTHTMQEVVKTLGDALGFVPIADKTGLTGTYDIRFGLEEIRPLAEPAPGARRGGGPQNQGPQFTTPVPKAVEDQLGLHLERARVEVDFIVIDHLELPTGN